MSTNLGPWINRRGIFDRTDRADIFREERVVSAQRWAISPHGQHIELGIAESNLFLQLAALGLAAPLFGTRLLPIGTLYDPFVKRGQDALNYPCYQDARFILVATPSGITLAPEGSAHQSVGEPLTGLAQPGSRALSRPMPTNARCCCAGPLKRSSARRANRSIAGCRPGRSISRGERSIPTSPRRSSPAPIGCASRRRVPSWRSPIAVLSPPRRWLPIRR